MEGEQLKQALQHDEAIKGTLGLAAPQPAAAQPADVAISPAVLIQQLDQKQALLAKTLAAMMLDTARTLMHVSMSSKQKMTMGKDGKHQIEQDPPKAEAVLRYLEAAKMAMEMAHSADTLADKVLVRESMQLAQMPLVPKNS